jgi:tetratricopeptide (TPR) repeat protein
VHVLQNQVASAEWVERSEGPLVVGWGGSVGHFDDVAEIAPAVSDWVRSNPSVRFKIMADEKFIPLFADIPPGQFEFVSTGSLDEYLAFVRGLDIGLAPLSDHPFNSCRTDGKFLEYASRGVISVCADMPSYSSTVSNGETGFLYKSTVDLINTLELLRTNAVVRHNVSKAGYHYVIQQRTENAAARHRLAFYRTLVAQGTESGSLTLQHIQSIPQIKPGDAHGHLLHELSDSEKLAYEGLVHQTNSDQSAAALKCLLQAIEKESSFFQAWLYAGTLLLDQDPASALDAITNALDLDPHSWLAAHKKAVALWRCGRAQEALNATRALQGTAPSFAPSFELEGEILMSLGQEAAATAALQQGIAANPFHSSALVRLGVLALNDGRPQDAEALFLKALDFNPDAANVLWGLAVALNAQHREDEAVKRCLSILQLTTTATPALTYIISIALKYLQANNFARASTLISEALGVAPNERDLLLWSNRIALLAKKAASNITAAHSSYF